MADIDRVIQSAARLCEPTPAESAKIARVADRALTLVKQTVSGLAEVEDVEPGGSYAKGTWLHGGADVDIFVKFNRSVPVEKFEKTGKEIGLSALRDHEPVLRYSDHPYVEAAISGVRVNVVPCYNVGKGGWQSAADRSVFHTRYVNERFDDKMRSEVRLLKRFLKTVGIYGAEISTSGFSGYVCEVLVLRYHAFKEVLEMAAEMQDLHVVAIEDFDTDIVKGFPGPLIVIDPVDPRRNLGTAISPESVAKFVLAARSFLAKPSAHFFSGKDPPGASRDPAGLYSSVLVVEFSHKKRPPDIVWGQLKRGANAVAKQLEIAGFSVVRYDCTTDENSSAAFVFLLESLELPQKVKRKGPEVFRKSDSERFIDSALRTSKKKRPYLLWADRDMRLAVLSDRKATDARKFVNSLLATPESAGVPRELFDSERKFRIYSGSERSRLSPVVQNAIGRLTTIERLLFGD
ncbi:MAG: CCA tRNA nucleotidyltransferase [Nitrososphaera sp.]